MATIGIDTGGTFTDFVWLDRQGMWRVRKQLSTPQDPTLAILKGIKEAEADQELQPDAVMVHGSTVATNAVLERKGARTALVTTAGFEDVLAIGRQNRPDLYALVPQKPEPLVPQSRRFGVAERVAATGDVLLALQPGEIERLLSLLVRERVESVAVVLLFSFLYPEHERAIRSAIQQSQSTGGLSMDLHVSVSSDILPEYREYERTATTVLNAYVAPLMSGYLTRLAHSTAPRRLMVMQSNGGVISARTAAAQAARTVLSGPAGGVVGARFVAAKAGFDEIITFDMGGTSTDVSLCPGGLPTTTRGEIAGIPIRLPIVDIHTVGAGGGSLVTVDAGGALHVGPQSAGAFPGPACYDLGSAEPEATTTDANLVLGRLSAGRFLGGTMRLNAARSRQALLSTAQAIRAADAERAAWDVIQVANAAMERAIRRISVERGHDPRQFTLVAFGGAGPLHACELAERLQIPRILVPPTPGVLSALGMLAAAPTRDYSQTAVIQLSSDSVDALSSRMEEEFAPLAGRALSEMAQEGYQPVELMLSRFLDMRYAGQSHEIQVPAPQEWHDLVPDFHAAHEKRYGYRHHDATAEIVTLRLTAQVIASPPELPLLPAAENEASPPPLGKAPVWFAGGAVMADLYDRHSFLSGHGLSGPAVIFQYDTTTVLPPGWELLVDRFGNLIIERV